ncbi:MAG: hypothetical protein H8E22_05555 [Candidatus Cloacimonetes bacterium]|nr:hypothetical protein [Candidatus Cloacimonadota bacterium]
MQNKENKKTKFWKTISIVILIFLLIKVVVKFIKEYKNKFNLGVKDNKN